MVDKKLQRILILDKSIKSLSLVYFISSPKLLWSCILQATVQQKKHSLKSNKVQSKYGVTQFSYSVVSNSAAVWTAARQASLSITNSQSLLKLMSIELMIPSNHLIILCHPLLLLPSVFPSIRVFSNESVLRMRWPKYWSFSFSISPSNEYSGLISFNTDWFDVLAVQGILKSLL